MRAKSSGDRKGGHAQIGTVALSRLVVVLFIERDRWRTSV
jgi:hypothetical protein